MKSLLILNVILLLALFGSIFTTHLSQKNGARLIATCRSFEKSAQNIEANSPDFRMLADRLWLSHRRIMEENGGIPEGWNESGWFEKTVRGNQKDTIAKYLKVIEDPAIITVSQTTDTHANVVRIMNSKKEAISFWMNRDNSLSSISSY